MTFSRARSTTKPGTASASSRRQGHSSIASSLFLALGAVAIVAYQVVPQGAPKAAVYVGLSLACATALLVGVLRHRFAERLGWALIIAGQCVYAVADVVWHTVLVFPGPADALYVTAYALFIAGLVTFARRSSSSDRAALLDALIIATGLSVLAWTFLIEPYADDSSLPLLAKMVAGAYPVMDLLLAAVMLRLFLGGAFRKGPYALLGLGFLGQLGADTVYAITVLEGSFYFGSPMFAGWMVAFTLRGAAALHPGLGTATPPQTKSTKEPSQRRLTMIGAAALLPPGLLLVATVLRFHVDAGFVAGTSMAMFLLVFQRIKDLTFDIQERRRAEAALRSSEQRLLSVIESTNDWIWETNVNGRLTYSSDVVESVLGYGPGEAVDQDMFGFVHGEDVRKVRTVMARASRERAGWSLLVARHRHKDGSYRSLESNALPILDDSGAMIGFRGASRDVTERRDMELQLTHQAFHDPLTNLANRLLFSDRVAHALSRAARQDYDTAVLFIDLDDFKTVNDGLGHSAGDQLLRAVAGRLRECVRQEDTAARLGGDEFAILLEDARNVWQATEVADRILKSFSTPVVADDREIFVGLSIGIALSAPGDATSDLLRKSDSAMYAAKAKGKGRHALFEEAMHSEAITRLDMKADLQRALEEDELVLHYQPIYELKTGRIHAVEALVRWAHPQLGFISPGEFIPLAEQTGQILALDRWVMRTACRTAASWRARFGHNAPLMSVNMSAVRFRHGGVARDVVADLAVADLPGAAMIVEITESTVVGSEVAVQSICDELNALRALGVTIALDDFGTGYSSLGYLKTLPIDILKIDKIFTDSVDQGCEDSALARAVVSLGRTLRMEVVAEGVERVQQQDALIALDCELAQGFLFARPLPADRCEALLEETRPRTALRKLAAGRGVTLGRANSGPRDAPCAHQAQQSSRL